MGKYLRRYFRTAWRHSFGLADLVSGVIAAAGAVVAHIFPQAALVWEQLSWQIPIWVFGGIILARLAMSPYWIWQEDQKTIAELKDQADTQAKKEARREGLGNLLAMLIEFNKVKVTTNEEVASTYQQHWQEVCGHLDTELPKLISRAEHISFAAPSANSLFHVGYPNDAQGIRNRNKTLMDRLSVLIERLS